MGTENNQRSKKKRMLIFDLTCCLSII
jgi:hypothetical protein